MKNISFVILHTPGKKWKPGVPPFEQDGLQEHIGHYGAFLQSGKLLMGGPFMDATSGGMMITKPGLPEAEVREFAAQDPAVKSGLLRFEVRPWMAGLKN